MIRLDYAQTRAAARKLNEAASECSDMLNRVSRLQTMLPAYWEGDSALAFSSEMARWVQETMSIRSELWALAGDITRIANDFEATDARLAAEANAFVGNAGGGFR